ncbi:MAG: T9SS type A sorting domain-containing protein, partial [Bacteroidia bacterium]
TTITLTVSNAQGTNSAVKTVTVINGTAGITGPAFESFEATGLPANWSIVNPSGGPWTQVFTAAKDGNNSYMIDGSQSGAGEQDFLNMPIIDLLNNQNDSLWFSYAYAKQTGTQADKLVLQGSIDCGGTWIDVVSLSASSMANGSGGTTSTPFTPSASHWKNVNVSSYPYWFNLQNSPSVSFRFVFTEDPAAGAGNNIYIDAVNFIGASNGINELTKSYKLNLFPNPSNGEATLKFNLNDAAVVNVNVIDVLGKEVLPSASYNYGAGEQNISINKNSTLSKGIYFVNLSINGAKMSKKLVIN